MHIDARILDNNSTIEGDICIIGAGVAGISIALEWMNKNKKVILLEGGGFKYDDTVQNLYKGTLTGQKYYPMKSSRIHAFGGTSSAWMGMCSPLDEIDFKKRDWINNSGWPINRKDLDPYYKRASPYLDLGPYEYDVDYWTSKDPLYNPFQFDKDKIWNKMWQWSSPTRFGIKYKEIIINSENINLYTYANVIDIKANEELSSINEVIIKNYANKKHKVRAKYFILACGAIQNSRILLASNSQNKNGLGNSEDLVGRYFMEHPEIISGEAWLIKPHKMKIYGIGTKGPQFPPRAEIAITEREQERLQILNGTIRLKNIISSRYFKPNIETWQSENPNENIKNWGGKNHKSLLGKVKMKINNLVESRTIGIENAYQLYIRLEQSPNPNSRVKLIKDKDSLGVPRVNLNWELTSLEKISIKKIIETLGLELGSFDIGRVNLLEFLRNDNENLHPDYNGGWHQMGTTRMHNNSKKGVVDSNCKVHGINNLFIAGSSCFPTAGAVNPTFSIVAISIRLSDYIKEII